MRICLIAIAMFVLLGSRLAKADDSYSALASAWCDATHGKSRAAAADALCTQLAEKPIARTARADLRQYFDHVYGVSSCPILSVATGVHDLDAAIALRCDKARLTSAPSFSSIGIDVVQGLGDLLVVEAKQEVLDFLLSRIGKAFCDYAFQVDGPAGPKIAMAVWFANSCAIILPNGQVDVGAFDFGALKTAFKADLMNLPGNLATAGQAWLKLEWPAGQTYALVVGVMIEVIYKLARHQQPVTILIDLGDQADAALKGHVQCNLTTAATITKECVAILGLEIARTAAKQRTQPVAVVLESAIDTFCTDYGAPGLEAQGACVVGDATYAQLHADLLAIYDAAQALLDLDTKLTAAAKAGVFADELSKRSATEWAKDLRALVDAIGKAMADAIPADSDKVKVDVALLDDAFDLYDAIIAADPGTIARAVVAAMQSKLIASKLGADTIQAISVVTSLALAKDRTEVQGILAEATAPLGSYKVKYGAKQAVLTLDGFVGVMAGAEVRFNNRNADGSPASAAYHAAPFKLSAPVGFDLTVWSGDQFHAGFSITAIDPLALVVSTANSGVSADWKTLLEPGAYFRIGVAHSPLTLSIGGNYQWGRRSDEMCGADRCFDGALQFGAFLNADVLLLLLR